MRTSRPTRTVARALHATAAVGALAACGDDGGADESTPVAEVAISGFRFAPAQLTVDVGARVTWTSSDDTQHTVTGRDAAAKATLDSESIRQAGTYEVTFDAPGAYAYFCVFHPNMQGTITVEG
jgi:plastocyanin